MDLDFVRPVELLIQLVDFCIRGVPLILVAGAIKAYHNFGSVREIDNEMKVKRG